MLKSCSYCGKIHDINYDCPSKPKSKKKITQADKFRWTSKWQKKRKEINERDKYMCQICIRGLYHVDGIRYNFNDIGVHHIISLEKDYSKRLDDENLVCLCEWHHHMAEDGTISEEELLEIAKEQEEKYGYM